MMRPSCEIVRLTPAGQTEDIVRRVCGVLAAGGLILYPTDTIYGLGCLADNSDAIGKLYAVKGRPESKPSLVLIDRISRAEKMVSSVPRDAYRLMEYFWPGPLTIVLKATEQVPALLTGGRSSVGIRLPANAFCRALAAWCGVPVVSTSANRSGEEAPRGIAELTRKFGKSVDLIVDAGDIEREPSTVVDLSTGVMRIVRVGAIPEKELSRVVGGKS